MIVVYLANRYIRIVDSTKVYTITDSNGCMVNGVIQDEEGLVRLLAQAWEEYALSKDDVRVILESSHFNLKELKVPVQKPKLMLDFVAREFADVDRIEDPVYGYFCLENEKECKKKKRPVKVYATLAPKSYLNSIRSIFQKLGIEITAIECARSTLIKCLHKNRSQYEQTSILQFVDDSFLVNVVCFEGDFVYVNRTRLFSDPDATSYTVEIARTVSNILQFIKAQQIADEIPVVYVAGLKESDIDIYVDCIANINSNIAVKNWNQSLSSEYVVAATGMYAGNEWTSLITQAKRDVKQEESRAKTRREVIPFAIFTIVLIMIAALLGGNVLLKSAEYKKAEQYINDAKVMETVEKYDELNVEVVSINKEMDSISRLKERVLKYPLVNSEVEKVLKKCATGLAEIKITSYNAQSGVLTFECASDDAEQIYLFINLLNKESIFAEVNYTGYSQISDNRWSVSVNCVMAYRGEEE